MKPREDLEPMNFYNEYSEWLVNKPGELICNGDDLIRHFERNENAFERFLDEKEGV